jgi:branched-chain amino acid transport system substrate-binding protein
MPHFVQESMSHTFRRPTSRREFLKLAGGLAVTTAAISVAGCQAPMPIATTSTTATTQEMIKVGVLLPISGIYATLSADFLDGMRLYLGGVQNQAGGRIIELIVEDDENKPDMAQQKARKLVEQDEVAMVVGVPNSGTLLSLRDYFHNSQKLLFPVAGATQICRELRSPYIWNTAYTVWMNATPAGRWAAQNMGRRAAISVPDYSAGQEFAAAFSSAFEAGGGEVVILQKTNYPNMGDAAPIVAELAESGADFLYAFYFGSGAVTFFNAYNEFGLRERLPLLAHATMMDEDVLVPIGESAVGILNVGNWAYFLDNPENQVFVPAFERQTGRIASNYGVLGYDLGHIVVDLLSELQGDIRNIDSVNQVLGNVSFASPRGSLALDANSHGPRQHFYLREVVKSDAGLRNTMVEDLGEFVDPGDNAAA